MFNKQLSFNRRNLFQLTGLAGLILAAFVLTACSNTDSRVSSDYRSITNSGNIVITSENTFDWGDININGGSVSHTFTLTNDGSESLYLKGAQTSCICTTAIYKLPDGSISPKYGMHDNPTSWSAEIKPDEVFEVNVFFDPLAHGPKGVGAIQRTIQLLTSATNKPVTELKVSGVVLTEEDYKVKVEGVAEETSEEK